MCNRVGTEGEMQFAGESLVIHPSGKVLVKASDTEQLLLCDINLQEVQKIRRNPDYLSLRRPDMYVI
jgi:predicted amidohydrolase